jgi:hypothetical protein
VDELFTPLGESLSFIREYPKPDNTIAQGSADYTGHRMRDFYIHHGLTPDICFEEINGMRLIFVLKRSTVCA